MTEQLDARGKPRSRYQTVNDMDSLTVQSQQSETEIEKIVARARAGLGESLDRGEGMFLDVSSFTDFADVMRNVQAAEAEFMKLPSKMREIFNHNVAEWLDHAHDEDKRAALVEAGYLPPPEIATPEGVVGAEPAPEDVPSPPAAATPGD